MTATSITSGATARAVRSTQANKVRSTQGNTVRSTRTSRHTRASVATYRRRRATAAVLVVGALSAIGLGANGVLTGPGGVPASAAGAGTAPPVLSVRAEPGDSLWSIAERFRGDVAILRYVDALIDLNGGTAIAAGQLVRLP